MLFEETVGLDSLPREEFNRRKASRIVDRRHDFLAVRSFGTPTDRASWVSASSFVGVDVLDIKDYSFLMGNLTKRIFGQQWECVTTPHGISDAYLAFQILQVTLARKKVEPRTA